MHHHAFLLVLRHLCVDSLPRPYLFDITIEDTFRREIEGRTLTQEAPVWVDSSHQLSLLVTGICKEPPLEGANIASQIGNILSLRDLIRALSLVPVLSRNPGSIYQG